MSGGGSGHLPIFVMIEAKEEEIPNYFNLGFIVPLPWEGTRNAK